MLKNVSHRLENNFSSTVSVIFFQCMSLNQMPLTPQEDPTLFLSRICTLLKERLLTLRQTALLIKILAVNKILHHHHPSS